MSSARDRDKRFRATIEKGCLLNLLVNVNPLAPPLTGIGRYTVEILTRVATMRNQVELRGFNDFRYFEPADMNKLLSDIGKPYPRSSRVEFLLTERVLFLSKKILKRVPGLRQLRANQQNRLLTVASRKMRDSVYWEPNFILGEIDAPSMVTIHDLSHLRCADFHPTDRLRWLERGMQKTLDRADRIMTVSKFSKKEIETIFGIKSDRITVVNPGVAECFRSQYSPVELDLLRKKYHLPQQYLLSVGTLEPRKNIKGLIKAYSRLPTALRKSFPLVLAGCQGWAHNETDVLIRRLQSRGELLKLGYVPQGELPQLYQAASAFVYISLYEGFGMPVAEAMASGIPVITSNCTSMPEVAAGFARLVAPNDSDSIVGGLKAVLEDLAGASEVSQQAQQISERYCWERSAQDVVNVATSLSVIGRSASHD